jgi:3-hydroxyisobutyrate dehydrogenase-like beta-hydroxyacid dehydrogenase
MMGGRMAANLVAAGTAVVGCDPDPEAAARAAGAGVAVVAGPRAVAEAAEVVLVVVRDRPQLDAVLLGTDDTDGAGDGDGGVLAVPGRTVVVASTVGPRHLAGLAAPVVAAGGALVDAPILSGSFAEAEAGTLVIVTSGPADALARVEPLLAPCGTVTRVGAEPGAAQAAKLVNQVMQAVAMLGTLEGVALGEAFGVDLDALVPLLAEGSARSWAVQNLDRVRTIWERPGDPFDLIYKDVVNVVEEAAERHLALPVTTATFVAMMRPALHAPPAG